MAAPTCAPENYLRRNERRTWQVIALTLTMVIIEIIAGTLFGSMALLAEGWPNHVTIEVNRRSKSN